MCSIIGFTKRSIPVEKAREGFGRSKSRGPDMTRFVEAGGGWLGFHRLAIMGLHPEGMQPFSLDGDMLVCNGEIYCSPPDQRAAAQRNTPLPATPTARYCSPCTAQYGLAMFGMLDAEFAAVTVRRKNGSLIAARDPIGIRPLFYGYLATAPLCLPARQKNLVGFCAEITPFPGIITRTANSCVTATSHGGSRQLCPCAS
jgi:asparagine synthase (glutamine-hydrolysing)